MLEGTFSTSRISKFMGDIPAKFSPTVLLIWPIRQLLAATDVPSGICKNISNTRSKLRYSTVTLATLWLVIINDKHTFGVNLTGIWGKIFDKLRVVLTLTNMLSSIYKSEELWKICILNQQRFRSSHDLSNYVKVKKDTRHSFSYIEWFSNLLYVMATDFCNPTIVCENKKWKNLILQSIELSASEISVNIRIIRIFIILVSRISY